MNQAQDAEDLLQRALRERLGLALLAASLLTGCAGHTALLLEVDHTSHPLVGWPVGPQHCNGGNVEVDITQANALLHWTRGNWYADAGLGVNLLGSDGGGFRGGRLTGTVRAGYAIPLTRGKP